jgi:ribonucleoside-triphosphate reductase (thioredoxin)
VENERGVEKQTPWGEIGYITYKRTYARRIDAADPNSRTEEFSESIERIIKACREQLNVGFNTEDENQVRDILSNLKGSVAGRFWWQLGTPTVEKLGLLSLQNCAFTVVDDPIRPFTWAMDALMLGSGVGYNIQKQYVYTIPKVKAKLKIERKDSADADYIVPDSREGWVKLLGKVLKAYFYSGEGFSYSTMMIRSNGAPIKGFGGTASGPEELCKGIEDISNVLNNRAGQKLRPIDCLDIMNIIGSIVVAGNVRRSAQIAIGDYDDIEFLKAKRWDLGPIPNWRNMSNNSVICEDTNKLTSDFWATYEQGEPYGLINIELSRKVGRLGESQYPDPEVDGYNPLKLAA